MLFIIGSLFTFLALYAFSSFLFRISAIAFTLYALYPDFKFTLPFKGAAVAAFSGLLAFTTHSFPLNFIHFIVAIILMRKGGYKKSLILMLGIHFIVASVIEYLSKNYFKQVAYHDINENEFLE